jgi:aquaporin Z
VRKLLVEGSATFGLVFLGTGACVVNAVSGGRLGVVGVGLAWGAAVWGLAALTGAHMNPAVTLAAWRSGRLPAGDAAPYAAAQACGAFAASLALLFIFRERAGALGTTAPAAGIAGSFVLEFAMTFALVLAVLRLPSRHVPAAAGAIVALEAIFAGPLTGASMNPVRSLAPALVSGRPEGLWIYLLAPMLGGWAAAACASVPTPEPLRGI